MPTAKKRHIIHLLAAFPFILSIAFPPETLAQQPRAQDVVFLVDCSESASPYLRPIAGIMSRFASGARSGDSLTCYQFSNNPVLIAKGRIERPGDVAQLKSQLLQLHTSGKYTNYFPALQQALAEIKYSYIRRPANDRILVLITDGRLDPDDTQSEATTLGQLLKRYSGLKAGKDYSLYCFYIVDWLEADLQAFLLSIGAYGAHWRRDEEWLDRLTLADVSIMTPTRFLGEIPDTPTQSTFSLAFYPRRPPKELAMVELSIEAEFTKETLDRFFDVRPRRVVCQQEAWTETFGFETRGFARGNYAGTLAFQPSEPQALLLYPRVVDFTFSIAETLQVLVEAPLRFGPTGFRGGIRGNEKHPHYAERSRFSRQPRRGNGHGRHRAS
jgi:hypothetical protein